VWSFNKTNDCHTTINQENNMTQKEKARVFDFIITLGTFEFMFYMLCMEWFDYKPKALTDKVVKFLDEKRH
jgi:hypothetical protein